MRLAHNRARLAPLLLCKKRSFERPNSGGCRTPVFAVRLCVSDHLRSQKQSQIGASAATAVTTAAFAVRHAHAAVYHSNEDSLGTLTSLRHGVESTARASTLFSDDIAFFIRNRNVGLLLHDSSALNIFIDFPRTSKGRYFRVHISFPSKERRPKVKNVILIH